MPSAEYNAQRAAAQNKPIELYEIQLLNGVIINLCASLDSPIIDKAIQRIGKWTCSQPMGEATVRPSLSGIIVDQPMERTGTQIPAYTRLMCPQFNLSTGVTFVGAVDKLCLSLSAIFGSVHQDRINDVVIDKTGQPTGTYDYMGWGDPAIAFEGAGNPRYHFIWSGFGNVGGQSKPRSLRYAVGMPGSVVYDSAPFVTPLTGIIGGSYRFQSPCIAQFYDKEGYEVDGIYHPEWELPVGTYSYLLFWTGNADWSNPDPCICWNGKLGMNSSPKDVTSAKCEAKFQRSTAGGNEWRYYGVIDPAVFRKKGSDDFHFFCVGQPKYFTSPSGCYTAVAYNRYNQDSGLWAYANPVPILGNTLQQPAHYYYKPQVFYSHIAECYYLVVMDQSNTLYGTNCAVALLFKNPDIEDEDGWVVCENLPPDVAFGDQSILYASNLFNVYADYVYGATYHTFPIKRDAIKRSSDDSINSVTVYLSNVTHQFTSLLTAFDIRMSRIRIKRTFADLDPNVAGNVVTIFDGIIDDVALDKNFCRVIAKESLLNWDMQFPRRTYSTICGFRFKDAGCGYAGPENYCDKTYENCQYYGNTSHFGGFTDAAYRQAPHNWKTTQMRDSFYVY